MFLNTPVLVNKAERDYIENYFKGDVFPWCLSPAQTLDTIDPRIVDRASNDPFFFHMLMDRSYEEDKPGKIRVENSENYKFFETIFLKVIESFKTR
jgi:hypothetical protein